MLLADGNPGAIRCMGELLKITMKSEFYLPFSSGTDIYVLYNDICDRDCFKVLALLSAVEIGYLHPAVLCEACSRQDYSGKNLIDIDNIVRYIRSVFPCFMELERLYK